MKKLMLALALLALLAGQVYAGQDVVTVIDGETLSGSSDAVEVDRYIGDADRVTFFVTYDQDATTTAVTSTVTVAVSYDGTNWQDVSWFDVAGGATPVTSEELTSDATYVGWLDKALTAPYMRIRVSSSGETGMSADVTVVLVVDK